MGPRGGLSGVAAAASKQATRVDAAVFFFPLLFTILLLSAQDGWFCFSCVTERAWIAGGTRFCASWECGQLTRNGNGDSA